MKLKAILITICCAIPLSASASLDELVNKWSQDLGIIKTESKLAKSFISMISF
jgi:hypothetical protein